MKIVAMIPARLGSKRVPKKNLRLLGGKPLISHILEAAIKSNSFDEIYINSEADEFKALAEEYKVQFYKRPAELASDSATNDEFAFDFIKNVECDYLVQLLPTSPFITEDDIHHFVNVLVDEDFKSLISVKEIQIECLNTTDQSPINFNCLDQTKPSQSLDPVLAYACGLMGWETKAYKLNMERYGAAYHGGEDYVGYYKLYGNAIVDIDKEEDFVLAEAILESKNRKTVPEYWSPAKKEHKERDVPSILMKDGVVFNSFDEENKLICNLEEILATKPTDSSWSHRIINSESNSATLIAQKRGEGNRLHYHDHWLEWWKIIDGTWLFEIEGKEHVVKKGDFVFIEKNKKHKITSLGGGLNDMSIRLAVSRADVDHIYV